MAGPVPVPAPAPLLTMSNTMTHNLEVADAEVGIDAQDLSIKIQYYTDYQCTKYNVEFTIQPSRCYNYQYSGTHSANAVSWGEVADTVLRCRFYSGRDCTGAVQGGEYDHCAGNLNRYESLRCVYEY
ncbi:uncharacterized protein B0I36DRAFT_347808 [Microdochium trichocladiopsis]|uniref:Uncharacterized protein n=1 Tax=Microdochium trichocladiopsis TaxID=1682393 RepID=A0A9P8Y7X3_9PEZI|nr:uncharacterized protein B0I36DRAFT_347808 [Microdochium trichocladiopsis]KAH7032628.1 hypothetical protein B0I36DRAFT_347808 [Microdochium trichocladiopsis]